ncbi:MAG: CrcB family protein [Flavobacteriales bacterium]|nr:CrcB family protein [Flavobacteriales bacterium]
MSTFNFENYQLMRDGFYGFAAMNILVSVLAGLLIFYFFARTT